MHFDSLTEYFTEPPGHGRAVGDAETRFALTSDRLSRENNQIHLTLHVTQPGGGGSARYPFTTGLRGNRLHFLFQILAEARKYASVPEIRPARLVLDVLP